jgi:hypothetical protein
MSYAVYRGRKSGITVQKYIFVVGIALGLNMSISGPPYECILQESFTPIETGSEWSRDTSFFVERFLLVFPRTFSTPDHDTFTFAQYSLLVSEGDWF